MLNRRQRGVEPSIVRHASARVERDIEVHADEDSLPGQGEITDRELQNPSLPTSLPLLPLPGQSSGNILRFGLDSSGLA